MKKLADIFLAARLYVLAIPFALFGIGAAMNQAVFAANGGKFPVMVNDRALLSFSHSEDPFHFFKDGGESPREDGMMDLLHCRMTNKTHLNWLADYINLQTAILSPGDLLIWLGSWLGTYSGVIWITIVVSDYARTNERQRALALD